jgi:hypothetical protein
MTNDYIMRQIEMISRMLAVILGHRSAGRIVEAEREIQEQSRLATGLSLESVQQFSPEALWHFLASSGARACGRALTLAELLLQHAEISLSEHRPADALRSQLQAFELLNRSIPTLPESDAAPYQQKLAAIATTLRAHDANPYVAQCLTRWSPNPAPPPLKA